VELAVPARIFRDLVVGDGEGSLSLHFGQMQGDFCEMQGGRQASPAKSDWISIIWAGLSLLQEQGGYCSLTGRIKQTIRFNLQSA
jgi:hypothetical protein